MLFRHPKIKKIWTSLVLISFLLTLHPSYAFRSRFIVPFNELEDALLNNFDSLSITEAALVASGIDADLYPTYSAEINRWENDIRSRLLPGTSEYKIAETVLAYLHDHVFTRYSLSSTTLKEVFESGEFNCLSATILTGILLQRFGIEIKGIVLPTHVYIFAVLDGKNTEIESTIKQGLLIAQDKKLQDQFNGLTGFSYENNKRKIVISWSETTGLLYSNRSYFDAQKSLFKQAFQNMMKAQVLLASAPSEESNLTAGYLNYSYYVFKQEDRPLQDYLYALEVLEEGISRYPRYNVLKGNYFQGANLVLQRMIMNNLPPDQIDIFTARVQQYLLAKDFKKFKYNRYFREVLYYLRTKKDLTNAQKALLAMWQQNPDAKDVKSLIQEFSYTLVQADLKKNQSGRIDTEVLSALEPFPAKLTQEYLSGYYSEVARKLFSRQNFTEAVATMEQGHNQLGAHKLIIENGFFYAVNAAQHFLDREAYEEALRFYQKATYFKNNPQVTGNMTILYEKLALNALENNNKKSAKKWLDEGLKFSPNNRRLIVIAEKM